ncbi:hypothetical protein Ciccas_011316 [Cichlidogyrus casuarinus]|uniref:DUF676 domain-containing protein n=1 Tax=Cichlidogyrus casuarinus TaxID=1844966 RepID=A0ABD2PTM3_9PLAT
MVFISLACVGSCSDLHLAAYMSQPVQQLMRSTSIKEIIPIINVPIETSPDSLDGIYKANESDEDYSSKEKPTVYEMLKEKRVTRNGKTEKSPLESMLQSTLTLNELVPDRQQMTLDRGAKRIVEPLAPGTISFVFKKENMKRDILQPGLFHGHVYSDYATVASPYPYFEKPTKIVSEVHLIVCVHGLDGWDTDLRLVRTYLTLSLPDCHLDFLMSQANQEDTFVDLTQLTNTLVKEILMKLKCTNESAPSKISFIGHSMGCVLIRSAAVHPQLAPYAHKFHTFLSLNGPHLGTIYSSSNLVAMGMWVMQKWKKSKSLQQLRIRDTSDPRQSFLYALSKNCGLNKFKFVLLVSSPQDKYVPYHSSRIELCKAALRDNQPMGKHSPTWK